MSGDIGKGGRSTPLQSALRHRGTRESVRPSLASTSTGGPLSEFGPARVTPVSRRKPRPKTTSRSGSDQRRCIESGRSPSHRTTARSWRACLAEAAVKARWPATGSAQQEPDKEHRKNEARSRQRSTRLRRQLGFGAGRSTEAQECGSPRCERGCSNQDKRPEDHADQDKAYRGATVQGIDRNAMSQDDGAAIYRYDRAQPVAELARPGGDGVCAGQKPGTDQTRDHDAENWCPEVPVLQVQPRGQTRDQRDFGNRQGSKSDGPGFQPAGREPVCMHAPQR